MAKSIVICSDGTGQDGLKKTNVARLFTLLDLKDPENQIACYDPGVGTIPDPAILTTVSRGEPGVVSIRAVDPPTMISRPFKRWAGLAVGYGLFQNVKEIYEVLIDHYAAGDRIYLFGFSRGAFTVRVLAGLLFRCGLLSPEHRDRYSQAFKLYKPHFEQLNDDESKKLRADVEEFKSSFARSCEPISFLGVWDTVKSVGYIWPKSLPHTRRNPIVKTVRHTLSIGENRSFFVPTTWGGLDEDTQPPIEGQDVQEIWFAGNHSDVGGGYQEGESGLATLSLKWMIREAHKCGLRVDKTRYQEMFAQDPTALFTSHDELEKWWWRASERLPRWELENDPPPPRRKFKWGPTGLRVIGRAARKGEVLIDSHAKQFYSTKARPWSDIDSQRIRVKFVDTTDKVGL
ncbi:MAG: DUF2235 domain-containing protein [Candidatus Binatia bacterium]